MLTLYPLQFGAPKGHGQVEGDEVFMVTHRHQEIKFHFSQHLWQTKHTRVYNLYTNMQISTNGLGIYIQLSTLLEGWEKFVIQMCLLDLSSR